MKVTFDNVYNAFQIIAPKGTMISFTGEPTALADGVYLVGDDGIINLDEQFLTDTLYLSTEGTDYAVTGGMRVTYPLGDETVIIRAGSSTIPFSKGGKGGGGSSGDNTHYKGTTTTPIGNGSTTNPITIDGEEYTAVFGDIAVYNYTEFVFDGTKWSEFGRPFDTTPTSGSANAVTSDGIKTALDTKPGKVGSSDNSAQFGFHSSDTGAKASNSFVAGEKTIANKAGLMAIGRFNASTENDLFEIGNGGNSLNRSNIVEVNRVSMNVNGDIKKNGVSLPTPYTTMPTITASMLGQIAMYVGETTNDYVKGYFYIASSDGAAEPTYSWVSMVDSVPTSGSANGVTSDGIYKRTPFARGAGFNSAILPGCTATKSSAIAFGDSCNAKGTNSFAAGGHTNANENYSCAFNSYTTASGAYSAAFGNATTANQSAMMAIGKWNNPVSGDLFNIGNGTSNNNRSNIVEVNSTSMNVNGDIQKNGVSLPTPYTTMPTITEAMLGQIAMYVGETTNDYVKGYFYIASSDGAAEPTYYWQPVDKPAYTLTTLWEYDGVDNIDTVGTVICSEAELAEYDFVGMLYGFRQMTSGVVTGQYSFAPTMAMPETLMSSASFAPAGSAYYNGRIGISNGNLIISAVANNTYESQGVVFRMGIYKVVAIKFGVSDAADGNTDDYTTTERKIGKWIDDSDLYQRTFEVTELVNGQWNNSVLGTSGINIVDVQGWIDWTYNSEPNRRLELNYHFNSDDRCSLQNNYTDLNIYPYRTESGLGIDKAVITIKYTKPSAQANLMQTAPTEEVSETPTVEEDDMR